MVSYPRDPVKGPVVIPNCAEVKFKYTQGGMNVTNVLHGNLTAAGPLNPSIAESIFSAVKANAATTTWFGHLHTGFEFVGVEVKDLRTANMPGLESTGLALAGTGAGAAVPQDCALCITLKTAFSGKGFFGRTYLGGLTVADLADSRHWLSTLGPPAIAFMNGLNSAMTAQGLPWVVAQRALQANTNPAAPPHQQQPRPAAVVPITGAAATDFRVDSQRRRLGR
jgi:hypothetical protein